MGHHYRVAKDTVALSDTAGLSEKTSHWLNQPRGNQQPFITLELSPPKGSDPSLMLSRAARLKGLVDAINVPDCQRALLRMSSLVAAGLIEREVGLPTVWQLTCRDRNLIALQADLLGAHAMGLRTILALTGDPVQVGDQKAVANHVFHAEGVALLKLVKQLNEGKDAVGKAFPKGGCAMVSGGAINPHALQRPAQRNRLCQKLEAGARFFQTQPLYQKEQAEQVYEAVSWATQQVGCHFPALFLGLVPPKHADAARFLNQSVPGISIPQNWIDRLEAETEDPASLAITLCCELAASLPKLEHQHWHLMPVRIEKLSVVFVKTLRSALGMAG